MSTSTVTGSNLIVNEGFFQNPASIRLKIYDKAEHVWSYLGKTIILTRQLMNAATKSRKWINFLGQDLLGRFQKTITRLKLFSIVSVPFNLVSLKSISEKIFKNYTINDMEGVRSGSLTATIIAIDVFDSISTFVNAVLELSARVPIASLSALGIPSGFAMSGLGTISRSLQITKICQVYKSISNVQKAMREAFLEKKLGVNQIRANLSAPLTEKVLKALPGDIESQLRKLNQLINNESTETFTPDQLKEISQILAGIQGTIKKKFVVEGLGIFANTLNISALSLICLGTVSSQPFLLMASCYFTRILSLAYQDLT